MKVYYDSDTDLDLVKSKKICIGYGARSCSCTELER